MAVNILAIETSCDESSAAVISDGKIIKSNIISSQIDIHQKFGGVVPEIASRKHLEALPFVVRQALLEGNIEFQEIDAIGVTYGPGLVGALLVGLSYAKGAAFALQKPLIGVHHLEGHINAAFLEYPDLDFPLTALVVSGGHTSLVYLPKRGEYVLLGQTRDDAAGEAFDKISRHLGLGYPGGPQIQKKALEGNRDNLIFPRAWLEEGSLDFSFSGLKSSVLSYLNKCKMKNEPFSIPDVAAGLQEAICEVLAEKAVSAAKMKGVDCILVAGGVAANLRLREMLLARGGIENIKIIWPSPVLCTDNAAMIGCAAYYKYLNREFADLSLNAVPNLSLFTK